LRWITFVTVPQQPFPVHSAAGASAVRRPEAALERETEFPNSAVARDERGVLLPLLLQRAAKGAFAKRIRGSRAKTTGLILLNRGRRPSLEMQEAVVGLDSKISFQKRPVIASSKLLSDIRKQAGCLGPALLVHNWRRGTTVAVSAPVFFRRR
jgi:hypothetical protein